MTLKINDEFVKSCLSDIGANTVLYPDLKARWSEPHRVFHNLDHLYDLYNQIERIHTVLDIRIDELQQLVLIAFFHDIIYNPLSSTNEEDSANLFLATTGTSIDGNQIHYNEEIYQAILSTKTHNFSNNNLSPICDMFNALDMNIVFRDINTLYIWESRIRKEYHMVPDKVYKEKRLEFLYSLLSDPVYMGNFNNLYELVQIVERKY